MSRWVIPYRPRLTSGQEPPDGPLARIVKYVPTEVVAAYTLLFTALVSLNSEAGLARLAAVGLIALFYFVTIAWILRNTEGEVRKAHLLISPLAYLAWVYPISSALLGEWFIPIAAFAAQAVVIALSLFIAPKEPI